MMKLTHAIPENIYGIADMPEGVVRPSGWRAGDWMVLHWTKETLGMQGRIVAGPFSTQEDARTQAHALIALSKVPGVVDAPTPRAGGRDDEGM